MGNSVKERSKRRIAMNKSIKPAKAYSRIEQEIIAGPLRGGLTTC